MMKKNKCSICLKVKGKRLCKLKNKSFICPRCCAEIRNADCKGCTHYAQAESYSLEKLKNSNYKKFTAIIDPAIDDEVDQALLFIEQGKMSQGETILNKLIQKHPDLYIVQYGMGTLQAMQGNYTDSIMHFDKCLEIFPYFVEAWFNRGNSYKHLLNTSEVIKSFQKVVEFGDPEEEFVQTSKEFLDELEDGILSDTGLPLAKYVESNDTFNKAFSFLQIVNMKKQLLHSPKY
jgi:tetratricopeptide (TPR) repeat protein